MTDLNLLCEEPYLIGLLGGISYIASSIGSLPLTTLIDKRGRKNTTLYLSLVTPLGVLMMTFLGKNLNLYIIYGIIGVMGFTYNARASSTFTFGSEFLCKESLVKYNCALFGAYGVFQALSGMFFWYYKSQYVYCIIISVIMLISIVFHAFFSPESPHYLLEIFDYPNLKKCLEKVAYINGEKDVDMDSIISKLKLSAEKELVDLRKEAIKVKMNKFLMKIKDSNAKAKGKLPQEEVFDKST